MYRDVGIILFKENKDLVSFLATKELSVTWIRQFITGFCINYIWR